MKNEKFVKRKTQSFAHRRAGLRVQSTLWAGNTSKNISMHILHTLLYTFPEVLQREFVKQSRASLDGDHFLCLYSRP